MLDKLKSRKFLLTVATFVVSSVALFTGITDFTSWSYLMITILGMYGSANVVDKNLNGKIKNESTKSVQ